jgi:hypothetical protein
LFSQGAKRCHDLGVSGWKQFIPLYMLFLLTQKGSPNSNAYGNSHQASSDKLFKIGYSILLLLGIPFLSWLFIATTPYPYTKISAFPSLSFRSAAASEISRPVELTYRPETKGERVVRSFAELLRETPIIYACHLAAGNLFPTALFIRSLYHLTAFL